MLRSLRPAIVLTILLTALTGLAYPLCITGLAQVALTAPAEGSLVRREGRIVGSRLVGQSFVADRYFHSRPSATTAPDPKDSSKTVDAPYNAASSGGSNLGPTSQKLLDRVKAGVAALRGDAGGEVPADAVTTSASGLDPDISPAFALLQVRRVAEARTLPEARVRALVEAESRGRALGLFGEPRVNVLDLNLTLDDLAPAPAAHRAGG